MAQPNNNLLHKDFINWVASQASRAEEMAEQARQASLGAGIARSGIGMQIPSSETVRSNLKNAQEAESRLSDAIRKKSSFDMEKLLDALEQGR